MKGKQQQSKKSTRNNKNPQEEAADYARRLCHTCRKALHRDVKHARRLQCQRVARQLKQAAEKTKLESKYQRWKQLPLDVVVETALQRLGISQILQQQQQQQSEASSLSPAETTAPRATAASLSPPPQDTTTTTNTTDWSDLTEKLLQLKQMQQSMEKWSLQVADYRKWCIRQDERQERRRDDGDNSKKSKKAPKKSAETQQQQHDYSQSIFLTLGGGDDNGDDDESIQSGGDGEQAAPVKKNRSGQRARQAKAMALQAKKEGRQLDSSLNWRTKKKESTTSESHNHVKTQQEQPAAASAAAPSATPSDEELHPSWVARKSQKSGISEFQGKRITFD